MVQGGGPYQSCSSLPYGDELSCFGPTGAMDANAASPLHFTGQHHDEETGLEHFAARNYTSTWGRWMTPDPRGGHFANPQTLDRYVYSGDSPATLTDPSGMDFYLTCTHTNHNVNTCQKVNDGGETEWVQGTTIGGRFVATLVGGPPHGALSDQYGQHYNGQFDQSGFQFTSASGLSSHGVFAIGTRATDLKGAGLYAGFAGKFNDNCGGTCVGSGSIFGTYAQLRALEARILHNPGLDFFDIFHGTFFGLGPQNYRDNNGAGPSGHLVSRVRTEHVRAAFDQFHYDGSYPYGPGFFAHAASAFRSIVHLFTGPRELPYPRTYP